MKCYKINDTVSLKTYFNQKQIIQDNERLLMNIKYIVVCSCRKVGNTCRRMSQADSQDFYVETYATHVLDVS